MTQKKQRVKLTRKLREAAKGISFSAAHKAARLFVSGRAQTSGNYIWAYKTE